METELRRAEGRIVTWIDLEAPKGSRTACERLAGEPDLLSTGEDRELWASGFRDQRLRKLSWDPTSRPDSS